MYPLNFLKNITAVQYFQITQRQAEGLLDCLGSTRLLVGSVRLPSCWLSSAGRLPGTDPLTQWLARFLCPSGWHGSAARLADWVPLPG